MFSRFVTKTCFGRVNKTSARPVLPLCFFPVRRADDPVLPIGGWLIVCVSSLMVTGSGSFLAYGQPLLVSGGGVKKSQIKAQVDGMWHIVSTCADYIFSCAWLLKRLIKEIKRRLAVTDGSGDFRVGSHPASCPFTVQSCAKSGVYMCTSL